MGLKMPHQKPFCLPIQDARSTVTAEQFAEVKMSCHIMVKSRCQRCQRLDNTVKSLNEIKNRTESIDNRVTDFLVNMNFMNKILVGFQTKCKEAIEPITEECDVVQSMVVELEQKFDKN